MNILTHNYCFNNSQKEGGIRAPGLIWTHFQTITHDDKYQLVIAIIKMAYTLYNTERNLHVHNKTVK